MNTSSEMIMMMMSPSHSQSSSSGSNGGGGGCSGDTLAIQNRKFAKTCVEKKRRDRINKCLDELKDIMSQCDDKARYQKMEKAEILEMAVNYMRTAKLGPSMLSTNRQLQDKQQQQRQRDAYVHAYRQCLTEFANCLTVLPGLRDELRCQVMAHMTSQMQNVFVTNNTVTESTEPAAAATTTAPIKSGSTRTSSLLSSSAPKRRRTVVVVVDGENEKPKSSVRKQQQQQQQNLAAAAAKTTALAESASSNTGAGGGETSVVQQYYPFSSKFGGSCSSLDSCMHPVSPYGDSSTSTTSDPHGLNLSSSSSNSISSPVMSPACSSPNSSSSSSSSSSKFGADSTMNMSQQFDCFGKIMWRPW